MKPAEQLHPIEVELVKALIVDHHDHVSAFALADRLEERGFPQIAFAVRWMGRRDLRPVFRSGDRIRKPWGWYLENAWLHDCADEGSRRDHNPQAILPRLVYLALPRHQVRGYSIYADWTRAIAALAQALETMRALLEEPRS